MVSICLSINPYIYSSIIHPFIHLSIHSSIRYSPVGIASIIAGKLLEVNSLADVIQELGLYVVCVLLGLFIHGCIILPIMYSILAWSNPLKLIRGVLQALLVAFGTSSRLVLP